LLVRGWSLQVYQRVRLLERPKGDKSRRAVSFQARTGRFVNVRIRTNETSPGVLPREKRKNKGRQRKER